MTVYDAKHLSVGILAAVAAWCGGCGRPSSIETNAARAPIEQTPAPSDDPGLSQQAGPEDPTVEAIHNGQRINLSTEQAEKIKMAAKDLLESCAARTRQLVEEELWDTVRAEQQHLFLNFGERPLDASIDDGRRTIAIQGMLIPLSGPRTGEIWILSGDAHLSPFISCDEALLNTLLDACS